MSLRRLHHRGMPVSRCPSCLYLVDEAGDPLGGDHVPRPGDVALCVNCGALMIFNADMSLRAATPEELSALNVDQFSTIKRAQDLIRRRGPLA